MSLSLYMDQHVPLAISKGLRRRGIDVLTTQDDGTERMEDARLLDRTTELGRVLFSEDDDLLQEACTRQRTGQSFSGVIYLHQMQCLIGQAIADLELLCKVCEPSDMANRVEYLPLR